MTPLPAMLHLLVWSVVLLFVHIAVQATLALIECGPVWGAGSRGDGGPAADGAAGRASRALGNLLQTYPAFVALALALTWRGETGGHALLGAQLWLAARAAYLPIYVLGVPWVRTLAFLASIAGLVMMLAAVR